MTVPEGLIHRSLADFTRAVAAEGPVPGSGSVSAAAAALGGGLAIMALRPAAKEGPLPGGAARFEGRTELEELVQGMLARVDEDARAYRDYLDARGGRGDLLRAVERSIAVPREVAEQALAALERLVAGLPAVPAWRQSEGFTAGRILLAAAEGALFTARANLPALKEPRDRESRRGELEALRARATVLRRALDEHFPGDAR